MYVPKAKAAVMTAVTTPATQKSTKAKGQPWELGSATPMLKSATIMGPIKPAMAKYAAPNVMIDARRCGESGRFIRRSQTLRDFCAQNKLEHRNRHSLIHA
jgi:hypothetical protein